jgi:MFS family permease
MIPVGSALGYLFGGIAADALGWRWAFYLVVPPGILLGLLCFLMRDPGRRPAPEAIAPVADGVGPLRAWAICLNTPSYALDLAGYTAMTFVVGSIAIVGPSYVYERQGQYVLTDEALAKLRDGPTAGVLDRLRPLAGTTFVGADTFKAELRNVLPPAELAAAWGTVREAAHDVEASPKLGEIGTKFGGIIVLAGLTATLFGSWLADKLRSAVPSSDFLVSGVGALLGVPVYLAFLFTPFPAAWGLLFVTVFFLFVNTGPVNVIFANVTAPAIRASAFALSIFVMHALGDVISPPIVGWVTDHYDWTTAFLGLSVVLALSGVFWLAGMAFLVRDQERAEGPVAIR